MADRDPRTRPGALDATVDAALDATVDAALDATVDAALDATSEAPATAADPALANTSAALDAAASTHATPAAGTTLGRYQLVEQLGAGAMGLVWRAKDLELKRQVALKLLRRRDPALTERLVREARSMAQVNHPNVVAVYEGGAVGGTSFIAMELVEGKSLRAWQDQASHTVPELLAAYVAAGRGLAAAHAAGIVHRDFKPENVLVGGDGRVRVGDFGLAAERPVEGIEPTASTDVGLTREGALLGTPAYMAPEQFAAGNTDSRTDQFSFCVALYEALYGERPFDGKTFAELAMSVRDGKLRPAPSAPGVSRQLRAILLRGMATRPGDRFPTMDHLLAELARDRAAPWRRTAVAAAVLAGVCVLGLGFDQMVRDRSEQASLRTFAETGGQVERAVRLEADSFGALYVFTKVWKPTLEVTANPAGADFGLGSPADDEAELHALHDDLAAADWSLVRSFNRTRSELAILDREGRVLYSSAAPHVAGGQLAGVPLVHAALAAPDVQLMTMMRYDDPELAPAHLFGAAPPHRLAVVFAHTLGKDEPAGVFVQFIDGRVLLDAIRLEDQTQLSLVAPDGTALGDAPPRIVARALAQGRISRIRDGGETDLVQALPIRDANGRVVGRLVMAARVDQLVEYGRVALGGALLAALGVLGVAWTRARRIATARV